MTNQSIECLKQQLKSIENTIDGASDFVYSNSPADNPFMHYTLTIIMKQLDCLMDCRGLLSKMLKEEQEECMKNIYFNESEIKAISEALDEYVFEHSLDDLPMHENGVYYGDGDREECDANRMNAIQSVYDKLYRRN